MAITAQEHSASRAPRSMARSRADARARPTSAAVIRSLPIIRLVAEIWAIPDVSMVGLHADGNELHVRVVIPKPSRDVSRRIYHAERSYLQATLDHQFSLQVVPASLAPISMPEPFETLLER